MDTLAERYVRLVLAVGRHDPDYVDAYYGPSAWKTDVAADAVPLVDIARRAAELAAALATVTPSAEAEELVRLRHQYLSRQLDALRARVSMLEGRRLSFDEESRLLYDAVAPRRSVEEFQSVLAALESRLPGRGSLLERYDAFRATFVIPPDRLDATFTAAIDGCRARTLEHVTLPADEHFTVEYVTNKSWSGYNWYQGGFRSVIQVNTDLPIYVDRALDLACHEGYPGHHVYNVLLEQALVRGRGWTEYAIYPLFSPQSLIAEGTANYGISVAFTPDERRRFEREVIFPAAGLDPDGVDAYTEVQALAARLAYAGNEAARRYLDGEIDAAAAATWLETYGLYAPDRARQRMRFIVQYRSYVINYNLGQDMVQRHVEAQLTGDTSTAARWRAFETLLSSPRLPSGLHP